MDVRPNDVVVDATAGGGGHARSIAEHLGKKGVLVAFDLDQDALDRTKKRLAGTSPQVHLVCADFRTMGEELSKLDIPPVTKILFDLGWSSYQLNSGRGFSFRSEEPLLMTYSKEPGSLTATVIINTWGEDSLADIIFGWGQERYSRRIARAIVERRGKKRFVTAHDLAEVIRASVPGGARRGRIHPATKTFQALRIAVNDELGALSAGLSAAWKVLAPGGRIAVITFHSIEDGVVKRFFAGLERSGEGVRLNRKPVPAGKEEAQRNPRARSAKIRAVEKKKEDTYQ